MAGLTMLRLSCVEEFEAYVGRLTPHNAAEAGRSAVLNQIEKIRNADRTFHNEAGASLRNIADRAVNRGSEAAKTDLCAFQDAPARRPPSF